MLSNRALMRLLFIALACLSTVFVGTSHAHAWPRGEIDRAEPEVTATPIVHRSPLKPRARIVRARTAIILGSELHGPSTGQMAQLGRSGAPHQIGVPRDVAALMTAVGTANALTWELLPSGGRVSAVSISSPRAIGLRIGLRIHRLPANAVVRFYATDAAEAYEISGREILSGIQRNLEAGDDSEDAHKFWSPIIDGSDGTFEIELSLGTSIDQVKVSVPQVSHLYQSALSAQIGQSNSCNIDVTCHSDEWGSVSKAIARITFTEAGSSYWCTGTLLADTDPTTSVPYFISANHCISSQTAASTVQTDWFYRSSSCNNESLYPEYQTVTGGATLLYASSTTDTSFLRLNASPPVGAAYAGWSVGLLPVGTPVTGIHHPQGDLQKIAFGSIRDYQDCNGDINDRLVCLSASVSTASFLEVAFSNGNTEPGSSGSGLFTGGGYLVGTLYGGGGSCGNEVSDYGRFDIAYAVALHQWLNPGGSSYAATVTKAGSGSGTVRSTPTGIACGSDCTAVFVSGTSLSLTATAASGSVFAGWTGACSGSEACMLTVTEPRNVTAVFNVLPSYPLIVSNTGTGRGTIASIVPGITCGSDCSETYTSGMPVTLSAIPAVGSAFSGWSGACSGTSSCTLNMDAARSVVGTFTKRADDQFPEGTLPAAWTQPATSDAAWTLGSDDYFAGGSGLKSGQIGNNQQSEISFTGRFPGSTVSFARKVSSEPNYDFLEFSIDGVLQARWSGNLDWAVVSFPLSPGIHSLKWRYIKDDSARSGGDAAWIDSITVIADGLWVVDAENTGQSGRGFQIEAHNGVMVLTYYGYGSDGNGLWALSASTMNAMTFEGTLDLYRGGTLLGGPYAAATRAGSAGNISLHFSNATHGTITFPGESARAIRKFEFVGSGSPTVIPSNGLWIIDEENTGDSGRGFQIEQNQGALVFTYYGYDGSGSALWCLSSGAMNGNSYSGPLQQYRGGMVLGGTYSPAVAAGSLGMVHLNFTSATTGTITFPGEPPKTMSKFAW
jgi:lysyl endopeptidase